MTSHRRPTATELVVEIMHRQRGLPSPTPDELAELAAAIGRHLAAVGELTAVLQKQIDAQLARGSTTNRSVSAVIGQAAATAGAAHAALSSAQLFTASACTALTQVAGATRHDDGQPVAAAARTGGPDNRVPEGLGLPSTSGVT